MPPTHLTSVDFPAPLSPTSAVTSPVYAVKSTSRSTCTAPKLLLIRRSSSNGVGIRPPSYGGAGPAPAGHAGAGPAGRQLIPAAVHLAAYAAAHRSDLDT